MSDRTMKMPFGKHKGRAIEAIPSSYLIWIRDNVNPEGGFQNAKLVPAAADEIEIRDENGSHFED